MLAEWDEVPKQPRYCTFSVDSCIEETGLFVAERMSQI
jgi:hypothetical protein